MPPIFRNKQLILGINSIIKAMINEISKKAEIFSQVLALLDKSFRLSNEYFSELSN
jgi:hypothetical protein